jgi:hypothetical protein
VFDPERDDDPGVGEFYRRLAMVALITIGSCLSLLPSVIGYHVAAAPERLCVAVRDGWSGAAPCESARGTLLVTLVSLAVFVLLVAGLVLHHRYRRTRSGRPEGRPQIANV